MVLFPNALSISFIATPSNLHHRLLCSVPAFFPFSHSCSVLVSLAAASCPFLFLSMQRSLVSHLFPALSTRSFMLPRSYIPLIPFSITFAFLFHFFLIQNALLITPPPPHVTLPPSLSVIPWGKWLSAMWCLGLSNGIILYIQAPRHPLKANRIIEIGP